MSNHPIEGLMLTAMNSIREMVDVNTIIGEPIETINNIMIIPISKVGFGFAAGGSEFSSEAINEYNRRDKEEEISYKLPFGGGSGAGVSISPVAFLVVQDDNVKLLPVNHSSAIDKLLDYIPDLMEKANCMINKQMENKQEEKRNLEKKINNFSSSVAKVHPKRNKITKEEQYNSDEEIPFEIDEQE